MGHAGAIVEALANGGSVEEHVARTLERIGGDDHNAFLHVAEEGALERARALDAEGPEGRPLYGLTVSVKDNLAVQGLPLTCASRALEGYVAPYSATVVERLEAAGAVVVGKGNLDEFGCGSSGENSAFGATENPAAPGRVPGGSSSGAGAALAAEWVDLAVGTDTGGSARCPAAFCGVTALKPSYGRVSRYGLVDLAMSLEGPAPMARGGDVEAVARLLAAMEGPDARDAVTQRASAQDEPAGAAGQATPAWEPGWEGADAAGLRVGVAPQLFEGAAAEAAEPVRDVAARLEDAGAELVDVRLESVRLALPAYYVLTYSEFASGMQRYDGLRYGPRGAGEDAAAVAEASRARLGPEVKRRILLGAFATTREHRARWYGTARAAKAQVVADFARAFREADVLLAPTMPFPAFPVGERAEDPLAMYAADVLTVSANLAGVPAGSVPLGGQALPVGAQVMGPHMDDARVLGVMRLVERLAGVGK